MQLTLQALSASDTTLAVIQEQITVYESLAKDQSQKKDELRQQAEKDQIIYDSLTFRDDQFDPSDAATAIAISLLAVFSLTQFSSLYLLALLPSGFGVLMGLSGLIGWGFHPDGLIKLLS